MDQPGIRPGALVRSLSGRDRGNAYVVLRHEDEWRAAVVDGRRRSMARPKVKNRRHLVVLGWVDANLVVRLERGDRVNDHEISKALEALPPRGVEEV